MSAAQEQRTTGPAQARTRRLIRPQTNDVHALWNKIEHTFPTGKSSPPHASEARAFSELNLAEDTSKTAIRRGTKTLIAILLALVVGWQPLSALVATTSAEAIVNARLVTLKSPVEGEVDTSAISVGKAVSRGELLMHVTEPRVDRAREFDIEREIERARKNKMAAEARLRSLEALQKDLSAQTHAFRADRISQLEDRMKELDSQLLAAKAVLDEASKNLKRNQGLAETGYVRQAILDRAERDVAVATQSIEQLNRQKQSLLVERDAAAQDRFVGDSFNDRPRSSQRLDELAQAAAETKAELAAAGALIDALGKSLEHERERTKLLTSADILSPGNMVVWETLTAAGERVVKGQEVIRLLDCTSAIISAAVDERVYQSIRVGDPVVFRIRGESVDRPGHVVSVSGMADAGASLAISPAALLKAPYRATIFVPSLTQDPRCSIGRTGQVVFLKSAAGATPPAVADKMP